MRTVAMLIAVLVVGVSLAQADWTITPSPQPAASPKVLVAVFQNAGEGGAYGWIGGALQEDLMAQVAKSGTFAPAAYGKPLGAADAAAAMQAGRDNGAAIVIFGSYQVVADQVRVTGQLGDVPSNRVVAVLQGTGPLRDLFKIEDALGDQLRQQLPQPLNTSVPTVTYGTPNQPYVPEPAAPVVPPPAPDYTYTTPYSPYYTPDYYYPDYGYAYPYYPYYYGGFIFTNRGFHHHEFFHHDGFHGGGGWHGGGGGRGGWSGGGMHR